MAIFQSNKREMKSSGSNKIPTLSVDTMLNLFRQPKSPRTNTLEHITPSSSPQPSPRDASLVPESPRVQESPRTYHSVPCTPTFAIPTPSFIPLKKCVSASDVETIKLIGVGSSSKVYLVRSVSDIEEPYTPPYTALKVISKEINRPTPEDRILSELHHPLIVQPLSYFEDETNRYIHMPYVAGGELFYHLRKYPTKFMTFNEKIAQFYIAEIILALEHIHSKGICYRDLKPENILLSKEGHVQLVDFGTAQFIKDVNNQKLHLAVGTLEYLAPEVVKMKKHEKEADLWALGIVFYEMLTGKLPFTSPLNSEIPTLVIAGKYELPPHLSPAAKSLIKGLLTAKPKKRLGCGKKGMQELKGHPFFLGVEWVNLIYQEPPITIQLDSEMDTKYFEGMQQ